MVERRAFRPNKTLAGTMTSSERKDEGRIKESVN